MEMDVCIDFCLLGLQSASPLSQFLLSLSSPPPKNHKSTESNSFLPPPPTSCLASSVSELGRRGEGKERGDEDHSKVNDKSNNYSSSTRGLTHSYRQTATTLPPSIFVDRSQRLGIIKILTFSSVFVHCV